MAANDSLKRLGGGRWETRDGRFAIEPQSGTWVIVDNEQTDELGLPLVRGPFGSLTAAKEAIEAARIEGPAASPLAGRLEQARRSEGSKEKGGPDGGVAREAAQSDATSADGTSAAKAPPAKPPEPRQPPGPRWLRDLPSREQRRARDLLARLEKMGVADGELVVRAELTTEQPALARLAIERALAKALDGVGEPRVAARRAVQALLRGADVELGVSWKLVDDRDRAIDKLKLPGD